VPNVYSPNLEIGSFHSSFRLDTALATPLIENNAVKIEKAFWGLLACPAVLSLQLCDLVVAMTCQPLPQAYCISVLQKPAKLK
jgi:hypothetical protein